MAEVKVGDRVKVEFEGVVTGYSWDGDYEVDGFAIPHDATVTVLRPEEPKGLGAVVRVTYLDGVGAKRNYLAVRSLENEWLSSENGPESWTDLFECDGSVEILSPGVDIAS